MRVGWRERVALPALGVKSLRAKLDTGARTSAIGVLNPTTCRADDNRRWALFQLRPHSKARLVECAAPVVDERAVRAAGGAESVRLFIQTELMLASEVWSIELGLARRDTMRFPMLIGRRSMSGLCVDPADGYLCGRPG